MNPIKPPLIHARTICPSTNHQTGQRSSPQSPSLLQYSSCTSVSATGVDDTVGITAQSCIGAGGRVGVVRCMQRKRTDGGGAVCRGVLRSVVVPRHRGDGITGDRLRWGGCRRRGYMMGSRRGSGRRRCSCRLRLMRRSRGGLESFSILQQKLIKDFNSMPHLGEVLLSYPRS